MSYYIKVASSGINAVPQYWRQQIISPSQSNIYYNFGNAGIGIPYPKASMHLVNNCSIGSAFATSNVPTDSLIVSSNVGVGTALPQTNLHVEGDTYINGNISAGNLGQFRNRIVNGDMRIDQRGGGATGVGASSSTNISSLDRWTISTGVASGTLCAAQTTLTTADQAAVGGTFTNATAIGVAPTTGLNAYYPFDGTITDMSGNGNNMTLTGSVSYVPGRVGSTAVYLANEANVLATSTAAAKYLVNSSYSYTSSFTVSLWVLSTKLPISGTYPCVPFSTNSAASQSANSLFIQITTTGSIAFGIQNVANYTGSSSIPVNTWAHATIVNNNGTLTFYVNGVQTSTKTSAFVKNGFILGNINSTFTYPFAGYIDDFRIYNRALSVSEIAALVAIAPIQPAPGTTLASGLSYWMTFDNVTTDSQGTLPAPVATGTTVYSSSTKSGTASLDLTGNTAGGTITLAQTYTLTSGSFALPLSIGFWMNPSSPTIVQVPISIGNSTAYAIQYVCNTDYTMYINVYIGVTNYSVNCPVAVTASTWYYWFLTINNSYMQLYINGTLIASSATGTGSLNSNGSGTATILRVGGRHYASTYAFKGLIDDVRIYTREFSSSEVSGLYYSYQPSPYVLFQQPIEGLNVADLAWGTTAAQPATVSAWIKNNTLNSQQFSLSVGNSGATATITAITFETDSGINDTLGLLTNPVGTNVVYSTSIFKVGTRSLNLIGNTEGGTPSTFISYNYNYSTSSLSVSTWFNTPNSTTYYQYIANISYANNDNFALILGNGTIYVNAAIGGTNYQVNYTFAYTPNTWYHICGIINSGFVTQLYINGILVGVSSSIIPITINLTPSTMMWIGRSATGNAFKGYIDDVRIYNKALSASEVYQLYANNATATSISQYLLPRSYLYTTPSIPAGAWQKINFTVPGDTTDSAWAKDTTPGLNLALCLGTGSAYTSSDTIGWTSTKYLTGSNIQTFGGSATNFLTNTSNNIYLTGVQIEKGTLNTAFELRNNAVERVMSGVNMVCQVVYNEYIAPTGHIYTSSTSFVDGGQPSQIIPRFSTSIIQVKFYSTMAYGDSGRRLYVDLLRSINGSAYTSLTGSRANNWTYRDCGWSDMTLFYRDTPNTTDTISYKVQFKSHTANTVYLVHETMGYAWTLTEISQ